VGGTVHRGAQSYIVRQADEELLGGLSQGEFCYVLDSRQIGKSSLMLRTAGRLREEGSLAIILDLTALGQNLTAEQWYAGLLGKVAKELWQMDIDLEDELDEFWLAHPQMGPFQRWMSALREVVLAKTQRPVVIFLDEIDAVRSLPFSTDEFFAGIREAYNRRTRDPEFKRLTFCLLGVATPSDLMQEARMTPFNIGKRIELKDFTPEEAAFLAAGLGRDRLAKKLLDRILYWTGGHPYLTQVLCRAVAEDPEVHNSAGVDRHCEKLFLSPRAREKDDNLLFVSRRVLSGDIDRAGLLHLYETIRARKRTRDDETNPLVAHLRLAGLTRVLEGYLWVRNRIYFRVFDREWVNANMPDAEVRRQKAAFQRGLVRASLVAAVIIVSLLGGIVWYWDAYLREHVTHYKNMVKRYGIPEGVGKLSTAQASHRAASLEFVTKGRYGPLLRVRAVDGSGALTPQHRVGTYLRYADEDTAAERECQWEFILDRDKRVVYEIARDRFNRLVWGFVYSPTADVSPDTKKPGKRRTEAKAHFVGPDGYPQPQRRSDADYVKITYDEDGNETKVMYTDR
jgi:AAA-like domain